VSSAAAIGRQYMPTVGTLRGLNALGSNPAKTTHSLSGSLGYAYYGRR
jgi:hypothetical protein